MNTNNKKENESNSLYMLLWHVLYLNNKNIDLVSF